MWILRPLRALAAAVILRSLQDAAGGDSEAAFWLDGAVSHDLGWALGVDLSCWRAVTMPPVHVKRAARGRLVSDPERSREYRRRKKLAGGVN
jgi:hypothetical protein